MYTTQAMVITGVSIFIVLVVAVLSRTEMCRKSEYTKGISNVLSGNNSLVESQSTVELEGVRDSV